MFDWITGFVVRSGYVGVLLLMLAENVVPPIPSELIMPLAGFTAARGQLSLALVILAGTGDPCSVPSSGTTSGSGWAWSA
jgi:membrane protein DedA with SNARE-associated domain